MIGVSTDKLEDQEKFTSKENLNFPLLADTYKEAAKAFGVLSSRGFAARVTFVIDKDGVVRKVYQVKDIKNHPDEVLRFVKDNLAKK